MNQRIKTDKENIDSEAPNEGSKNLFITAFSDGSFCQETKAWGVGVWIRDGDKPINTFGLGGIGYTKPSLVEDRGVAELIKYIAENCDIKDRVIVIQCDCDGALLRANTSVLRGAKFIKLKHVKGHTTNRTKRTTVNGIVDRIAGEHMNKHRATARKALRQARR